MLDKVVPHCSKCVYYFKNNIVEWSECLKFGTRVPYKFELAKTCRDDATKCGADGTYFICKNDMDTLRSHDGET